MERSPEADALGDALYRLYPQQVQVTFPSIRTSGAWEFTPQGWVGLLPLGHQQTVSLQPKAPISNIFRMWCQVHGSKDLRFLEGLVTSGSDAELTSPLVRLLVELVQRRLHQGLYRTYLEHHQRRYLLAGRLDIPKLVATPWRADLPCKTSEQTADVPENQILAWTFHLLGRSSLGSSALTQEVRKLQRGLAGFTSLLPFGPEDCWGRTYHRLNEDYELLHSLCGFFLAFISPDHRIGDSPMRAFRVDMAKLFEGFVAAWLERHLPGDLYLRKKEPLPFGGYEADMVIFDRATERPLVVLDAKYKCVDTPASGDVHQVRSYAEAFGCRDSVLIYPVEPQCPIDYKNRIHTRSAVYRLDKSLDKAGEALLEDIFPERAQVGGLTA
jgi:5-methylcytosine-specific restriction enzyme subunit McrC